jgi:hydrogenase maturation protein HypF
MLMTGVNCPRTSSMGRFLDAVASLLNLRQVVSFEAQAAMLLEFLAETVNLEKCYEFELAEQRGSYIIDWQKIVEGISSDLERRVPVAKQAARLHNTLAEIIVAVADKAGLKNVVLSGGCFQNKYLTERTIQRLEAGGYVPYWHRLVPPNDGGIALGQVMAAQSRLAEE